MEEECPLCEAKPITPQGGEIIVTKAIIELEHFKLTREQVKAITEHLAHSSQWSWCDFQWSMTDEKTELDKPIYGLTKNQLDNIREVLSDIVQLIEGFITQFNLIEEKQQLIPFKEIEEQ